MRPLPLALIAALTLSSLASLAASTALAQDAATVAPQAYKVLFENDHVRVLDYHAKPGGKAAMHSHPALVAYAVTGTKVKFTSSDGKSQEQTMKAGDVMWRDAETHATENVGKTPAHVVIVELKK
jgi:beta-alanine degradation protein BauB